MEHLYDSFAQVLADSGLTTLLNALPAWLAFDERQLIFVLATPVFIGVFATTTGWSTPGSPCATSSSEPDTRRQSYCSPA